MTVLTKAAAETGPVATDPVAPARRRRTRGTYWLFLVPGAVLFALIILGPLAYNIYLSFTKWSGVGDPRWRGFDNYVRLFGDEVFWTSF